MSQSNSEIIILSNENFLPNEAVLINSLFDAGLQIFHLRKPSATKEAVESLLKDINPKYRNRIALNSHHDLAKQCGINRVHFPEKDRGEFKREEGVIYSTSFHSIKTAKEQGENFDYYFMSPIFDSISKKGYKANPMKSPSDKAVALGGICLEKLDEVKELGYKSIALLGTIWQEPNEAVERFLEIKGK